MDIWETFPRREHAQTKELSEEEKLLLSKVEADLKRAQEAYDALQSLRIRSYQARLSFRRNRPPPLTKEQKNAKRAASKKHLAETRLADQRERERTTFIYGFQYPSFCTTEAPENLIPLYRSLRSLDQFAKQIKVSRRTAIHLLMLQGLDVFEDLAREWETGSSLRELSTKHGPKPKTIASWIRLTGREIKPRNSNQKYDRRQMNELFDKMWTTNKVAKEMGLSWATVQKVRNTYRKLKSEN